MLFSRFRGINAALHPNYLGRRNYSSSSRSPSSIQSLQAAFQDPTSPFYIQPGTQGPVSADAPPSPAPRSHSINESDVSGPDPSTVDIARKKLIDLGYDPTSFWEQKITWGFHDALQHVNNVHYFSFFESSRIQWMISIGNELGGPAKAESMLKAKGVGFILKYLDCKYRRPVTYPDTLLIAHKPSRVSSRTEFKLPATAYSYAQSAIVAESDSVTVWYDYDKLRKCDPGDEAWAVIKGRIRE
ncbi:hypothetical protein PILCRDRAFT_811916 [Piloderma croceum F 1598]|uniref:Thioesterase domain-containing protein n=1 Tax=Piloderma croceum (strain F 1598) TaxID=765440 RepID=A0A0C3GES6_PILCF|nr:hypothetical protein PILCRDRAFT_811916 [Piloderma croceum F 1598]